MRFSQTTDAYKQLTRTMLSHLENEQKREIDSQLQQINSVMTDLSNNFSSELPKPVDRQIQQMKLIEAHLGLRTGKPRPQSISTVLSKDIANLRQEFPMACLETWLHLVSKFSRELESVAKLFGQIHRKLSSFQAKHTRSSSTRQSKLESEEIVGTPFARLSVLPSSQSRETNAVDRNGMKSQFKNPDRPLRAREMEAIQEFPFNSPKLQATRKSANEPSPSRNRSRETNHKSPLSSFYRTLTFGDLSSEEATFSPPLPQKDPPRIREPAKQNIDQKRRSSNSTDQRQFPDFNSSSSCDVRIIPIDTARKMNSTHDLPSDLQSQGSKARSCDRYSMNPLVGKPIQNRRQWDIDRSRDHSMIGANGISGRNVIQGQARSYGDSRHSHRRVIATHQYRAQDLDELTLQKHDILNILPWPANMEIEPGWLYGERVSDGKRGLFPSNFTRPY